MISFVFERNLRYQMKYFGFQTKEDCIDVIVENEIAFALPYEEVQPTVEETWDGVLALAKEIHMEYQ